MLRHHDAIRNATPMFLFFFLVHFLLFFFPVALLLSLFLELRDALFVYHSSRQYTWTWRVVF